MKTVSTLIACFVLPLTLLAQNHTTTGENEKQSVNNKSNIQQVYTPQNRQTHIHNDTTKTTSVAELFALGEKTFKSNKGNNTDDFKAHLRGFHFGFINFANLPDEWNALKLKGSNSFSMRFNILNRDMALNKQKTWGIVAGLGIEYQRFKFNDSKNTIVKEGDNTQVITHSITSGIYRSVFKNLYLSIPLMVEKQFCSNRYTKSRPYISAGFIGGVRMHSKTKIVYKNDEDKKRKLKDKGNFNMVPFKVDAVASIGYRAINIWGSYTLTNTFKADNMPHLHVYTLGFGITL